MPYWNSQPPPGAPWLPSHRSRRQPIFLDVRCHAAFGVRQRTVRYSVLKKTDLIQSFDGLAAVEAALIVAARADQLS